VDEDALVRQLQDLERRLGGGDVDPALCRAELARWRSHEADQEFRVSLPGGATDAVVLGVCLRYGANPYRAPRQKNSTVSVSVPPGFMREVMEPRIRALAGALDRAMFESTRRVVERWSGMSLKEFLSD
jgi:hypothetical protein